MDQLFRRLAALTLATLLAAPATALAGGSRHHHGQHDWRNFRQPSYHHHHKRHYEPYRPFHHRSGQFHRAPKHGHVYSLVPPWPGYGCRPVVVIDRYRGSRAKRSGSLCYDTFGRAVFVPGGRYPTGYRY
ncbi:MAG: hypothetical protein ACFCUQ_06725 [Kiloniellales bacterium]